MRGACLQSLSIAVCAVLRASSADAQAVPASSAGGVVFEERLFAGIGLVHDNDNLPHPGNTLRDDNYSAAYELRVNGRIVERLGLAAPLKGLDWLTRASLVHARGQRRFHSAQAIGVIYTPDRIASSEVQTDDRPYASLMAVTVTRTSILGAALDREWSTGLSLGMLGLELPGEAQRLLHRTRRWMTGKSVPPDPLGWDNQISAGGEPTGLYHAAYRQRIAGDGGAGRRKHWEVLGGLAGEAGYSVSASAEVAARVGAFSSEFWEFPRGVGGAAVGQQGPVVEGQRRWDVMVFALVRPRAVAYDALLQGQFRRSVFTVPVRHGLIEWEGGLGGSIPMGSHQLQVVVQLAQGRTADYIGPKASAYTWGTVGLFFTNRGSGRH